MDEKVKNSLIFNTFVLCQVFKDFNGRHMEKNMFKGILKNMLFLGITRFTIVLHVVMVEFLHKFVDIVRLDWRQWLRTHCSFFLVDHLACEMHSNF